jgi:hypothetical protein
MWVAGEAHTFVLNKPTVQVKNFCAERLLLEEDIVCC